MNEQNWFYIKNEQQCGPVSRDEIIRLLAQGELTQDTSVWAEGTENWQPISQTPDFAALRPAGLPVQRPTSVTVLGILNIIFGSLGFLCAPLAFFSLLTNPPADPFEIGQNPTLVAGEILDEGLGTFGTGEQNQHLDTVLALQGQGYRLVAALESLDAVCLVLHGHEQLRGEQPLHRSEGAHV